MDIAPPEERDAAGLHRDGDAEGRPQGHYIKEDDQYGMGQLSAPDKGCGDGLLRREEVNHNVFVVDTVPQTTES